MKGGAGEPAEHSNPVEHIELPPVSCSSRTGTCSRVLEVMEDVEEDAEHTKPAENTELQPVCSSIHTGARCGAAEMNRGAGEQAEHIEFLENTELPMANLEIVLACAIEVGIYPPQDLEFKRTLYDMKFT